MVRTVHANAKLEGNTRWRPKTYQDNTPQWGCIKKCITVDIPFVLHERISAAVIIMSKSIFQNGKRPSVVKHMDGFSVYMHYPGQRYRFDHSKTSFPIVEPNGEGTGSYGMRFQITNMEVLHQRNTQKTPCHEETIEEDASLKTHMVQQINCLPPYWTQSENSNTSECTTKDELRKFYNMDVENYMAPCRRLSLVSYDYSEYPSTGFDGMFQRNVFENHQGEGHIHEMRNVSLDVFYVVVYFPQSYKEIVLTRRFDLQSLIGNAGGYVGICVGYSVLQLPQLFMSLMSKVKTIKCGQ